jgi:RNA polymerase sigma-70 factor (ECF subfamily)
MYFLYPSGQKKNIVRRENYFEESFNNIESQFSIADIQYLIDSLPDGYKMVFNLYAIEGYIKKLPVC